MKTILFIMIACLCMLACGNTPTSNENHAPEIISVVPFPSKIKACTTGYCGHEFQSRVVCDARDADGDRLTYSWSTPGCLPIAADPNDNAIVIICDTAGYFRIACTVRDNKGIDSIDTDGTFVEVCMNCTIPTTT